MPIYEYKCSKCGHEYEIIQKVNDAPVLECEKCHLPSAVKLVSAPSFQLKGTGWYETDFKNKDKPKATSTTQKADVKTEVKSGDKDSSKAKITTDNKGDNK